MPFTKEKIGAGAARHSISDGGDCKMEFTREWYYEQRQRERELMKDPENVRCPCVNTFCQWHGRCHQCVAVHRYYKDHIPSCLNFIIQDKLDALAGTIERSSVAKEIGLPQESIQYALDKEKEDREKK